MFKVPGPSVLEGQILHDIEVRTGLHYKRIGGIDTSSKEVAESVLPVALEWVHLIGECPERDVLQQLFTSSHAGAYLTEIISWWKRDASRNGAPDTVGYLSEALARVAHAKNAKEIWSVVRDHHGYPGEFNLLVKLSGLRATQEAVCGTLAESLGSMQLRISDYETIVRAKCPQVQAWFLRAEEQLPVAARSVAARARRRNRKNTTYKSSLARPDRKLEIGSVECDVTDVHRVLSDFALTDSEDAVQQILATAVSTMDPTTQMEQWYVLNNILSSKHGAVDLWIRAEDVDVVEFVLVPRNPKREP